MAAKKKVTTASENTVPLAWVEDQGLITTEKPKKLTAKEYIDKEYPTLNRFDSIPALLMAILTEIVKGRIENER